MTEYDARADAYNRFDGSPPEEGGTPLAWRSPELAPVTLRLATPRLIIDGLRYIGLDWAARPFDEIPADDRRPGMYTWVDGIDLSRELFDRAVLYTGVGQEHRGVRGRVVKEMAWASGEHAHGLMLVRRKAEPILGAVTIVDDLDLQFLKDLVENDLLHEKAVDIIRGWGAYRSAIERAEEFAIRLSIHLGDTVSPVNSQYAGAWRNLRPADWAAYAVAMAMSCGSAATTTGACEPTAI
ncbi:MAG: hypothetical protein ACJA07_001516 [Rhodococcus sp. (in: high G+C Gram-positive bacteria)]|jgi:hypothetical protein